MPSRPRRRRARAPSLPPPALTVIDTALVLTRDEMQTFRKSDIGIGYTLNVHAELVLT